MERLPNLDPLRFFLASLVILFHLPQLSYNQGLPSLPTIPIFNRGTEAVYMFFILSGFLIIRGIYRSKLQERFSIKKFYIRRILRIFPLYYLIVAFGFFFYNFMLPLLGIPFEINYNLKEGILMTVFFLPNVFGKMYEPGGILEILWSIGIEEQFYIMIAPLLFSADEVAAGKIDHAIRFILPNDRIKQSYVHPASHGTRTTGGANAPSYGVHLRLRADFDLNSLPSAGARVVARAMQTYGMYHADGGNIALTAQSDLHTTAKWAGLLDTRDLTSLKVEDFEVIDHGPSIPVTFDCVRN